MEINTGSILSYQKNQNMAGTVAQNGALKAIEADGADRPSLQNDDVSISNRRDIYNWVAANFPITDQQPATISRASQTLYDYQILSFTDLSTINQMISQDPEEPMIRRIENSLKTSQSYQEQQHLSRIHQVFETLAAAEDRPVS
ncbi:hypothetical protein [Reinekea sp.]|jgi:hypothetical protein|uniref:hypothetical protein n=1 Tax=Reinekea sp. TaxID=1970455 RepID=UPI002A81F34E|nr:hypothetical protein [Reinekea sp.]